MRQVKIIVSIAFMMFAANANAQVFQKGSNVISAGIGLGSSLGSFSYGTQTPAFSVQFEHGTWDIGGPGVISLGGYAGVKSYKYGYSTGNYSYTQKWSYTVIGIRGAYHYNGLDIDKVDVYGGAMVSYNILKYSFKDNGTNTNNTYQGNYGSNAGITAFVGGRYFFAGNLAGFAEAGYGVSYLTLGIAYKFLGAAKPLLGHHYPGLLSAAKFLFHY